MREQLKSNKLFLLIDTSTDSVSLKLIKDNDILSEKSFANDNNLSENLLNKIDQLIQDSGFQKKDISAIVVNSGPGSYTSIRIGVTTANIMALSLGIPIYDVDDFNSKKILDQVFFSPVLPKYSQPPFITKKTRPF